MAATAAIVPAYFDSALVAKFYDTHLLSACASVGLTDIDPTRPQLTAPAARA